MTIHKWGKRKMFFVLGMFFVLLILVLCIYWDRIQYIRVLNDFYSGNLYLNIKARVPEEIRERYYRERYETTEEEYKENSPIYSVYEYKIRKVRNVKRLNSVYNTESTGQMDMEQFRGVVLSRYGKYGMESECIEKSI